MKEYALDIETESITADADDALHPHLSRITVIGVWSPDEGIVFRDLEAFKVWHKASPKKYITHNGKFDYKHLAHNGIDIFDSFQDDTLLMAVANINKIPEIWLKTYNETRQLLNKAGAKHRNAGKHSLKTLAPYFLNVEPFWEVSDKDDDAYVLKDCEYTYKLRDKFLETLDEDDLRFYYNRLIPWHSLLYKMERRGIRLDLNRLEEIKREAELEIQVIRKYLNEAWAPHSRKLVENNITDLRKEYEELERIALEKLALKGEISSEKREKLAIKYAALFEKALPKVETELNLNSPSQLAWLFKECLQLDITNLDGEESTGKEVLQRLAGAGRQDVKQFFELRKLEKLISSFVEPYQKLHLIGYIHSSFNLNGTRTGRLSSNSPNLQQVSGELHELFVARPGYKLITRDAAAIEPRLIAHYTQDPTLIELFASNTDFHGNNAKIAFNLREDVKNIKELYPEERALAKEWGLSLLYGAGSNRILQSAAKRGKNFSELECKKMHRNFKEEYKSIYEFKQSLDAMAEIGTPINNVFGRRFKMDSVDDNIYMQCFNTLIQGSASDLILESAYRAQTEFERQGLDAHILLLVHDEIVAEAKDDDTLKKAVDIIERCMTDYDLENVKLKVEGKESVSWEK